jgi:hypothetical protein
MAHYGTLGDYRFTDLNDAADDIRGANVYGPDDEKLGKIDDVIFDHASGGITYVVIDTGGWLSSKKFIVPPNELHPSLQHRDDYRVELSKERIETFLPYDGTAVTNEERWADYEKRYRSNWVKGPVMHREETDRNITPTTSQLTKGSGATGPKNWETGTERAVKQDIPETAEITSRIIPPTADAAPIENSAVGIGSRYLNFEERLRQRRKQVVNACVTCGLEPQSQTASEREREERRRAS